jgi:cyclic pyranopterin phosphate synthase
MVDVSGKPRTARRALASGRLRMEPATLEAFVEGTLTKGEAWATARIAGIQAAKRTDMLVPLCHSLPELAVRVDLKPDPALPGIVAEAEARGVGATGVEMEALAAVSAALLTLYDMAKAVDRGMSIEQVQLLEKEGGASGHWRRDR